MRQTNIERAFEPGSMPLPLRPDCGCLSFSLRMRAVWRHDVFMTRVIRQKNGIDTLYTPHTIRGSGDAVLTNEKLPRVASRRREVQISGQNPFRGYATPREATFPYTPKVRYST